MQAETRGYLQCRIVLGAAERSFHGRIIAGAVAGMVLVHEIEIGIGRQLVPDKGKHLFGPGDIVRQYQMTQQQTTLAHYFKGAGYRVGYVGKWHLSDVGDKPVPAEHRGGYVDLWQAADVLEFTSKPYGGHWFDGDGRQVAFEGYRVDALADTAVGFIRQSKSEPFFLMLSWLEPHHQNDMKRFVAPEGYAARYADCHVPADLRNLPGNWMSQLPDYYGICARIDENVGRILACLDELGLTESTIVVFTSDHGCHFRTRNGEYKRSCHDGSIRIPMVFAGPGFDGGPAIDELVSLVDVPPTLLDAAGLSVPKDMHGRSMLALPDGRVDDWPEEVFFQISEAETGRGIRSQRWKYSVSAPGRRGGKDPGSDTYVERYLYDLHADPAEQVNLIGRREYADVAADLRRRLIQRILAAGEAEPTIQPAQFYA